MAPKTIKKSIADALEDLSNEEYDKFCFQLRDRREEPTVKRSNVEGKGFLVVADVLVRTFTEPKALEVTLETLREIRCHEAASNLEKETSSQASKPDSSNTATPSAGATNVNATGEEEEHFVDKYQLQLIRRVSTIPSILDELLVERVITKEVYDEIRALPTSQRKMRELYSGPLQAGTACKDVFYKILVKNERYLIEDLKKTK